MFKLTRIPIVPVRGEPVRLPITITLGVPDDHCIDRVEHVFNVPGAIYQVIGSAGWDRARQAIQPLVWAPGWTDARLAAFVTRAFAKSKRPFPASALPQVRTHDLLPSVSRATDGVGTREILHLIASFDPRQGKEPMLRLGGHAPNSLTLSFGALRDAFVSDNTRLLILQVVDLSPARAGDFAERMVGSGGPATLVVAGASAASLDRYFLDFYANLIHNVPLPQAAGRPAHAGLDVNLAIGKRGEGVLQLNRWLDEFRDDLEYLETATAQLLRGAVEGDLALLHQSQVADLKQYVARRMERSEMHTGELVDAASLKHLASKIAWARESTGLLPLSELAQLAGPLQHMARRYREDTDTRLAADLKALSQDMVVTAPRVLNANFALPGKRRALDPNAPLRRGRRYDLLVDVGPRWDKIASLVQGNAGFPEAALPPGPGGHAIRVVLFSDDFGPAGERRVPRTRDLSAAAAMGELWLPHSGRSHPMTRNKPAKAGAPVRLPVVLRKRGRGRSRGVARARLCLYFAGNLLQSAVVTMQVSHTGTRAARATNAIVIDYVFSGSFADIGKFATRKLDEDSQAPLAVGLNIAMNDDGAGGHRIMVKDREDLTVWRPYDPAANKKLLEKTRLKLRECFARRDANCAAAGAPAAWTTGLDADNGKTKTQFRCDLWQLAWYGSDLYTRAFGQLSAPGLIGYLQQLDKALAKQTVIQIARTNTAQYVYPWALVYDIPLPDRTDAKKLTYCKSFEGEWGEDGRRRKPPLAACPHNGEPYHQKNVLCPYGFWGLKHTIEQPINVDAKAPAFAGGARLMPDVASGMTWAKPPSMSVGLTRDASLDSEGLLSHLSAMEKIASCTPKGGAETWDEVQAMLGHPDIVYFLCHGEFDEGADAPYLGIGAHDASYDHRVYPDQLLQWARTAPGTPWAADRHPLVFINGCHTADLVPDQILNFVNTFAGFGAGAVIGTEVSIRLPLAVEVAENFFQRVAVAGETVGGATRALRWDLANKGNLLGLAYTPYGLSDLKFQ